MKRLVAKTGVYTNKEGAEKGEYTRIGVLISNDNGEYMLLDPTVNLAGCLTKQNMMNHKLGKKTGSNLMVSVFSDEDQQSNNNFSGAPAQPEQDDEFSDDIPF